MMKRLITGTIGCLVCIGGMSDANAIKKVTLDEEFFELDVKVNTEKRVNIYFPNEILIYSPGNTVEYDMPRVAKNKIEVQPSGPAPDTNASVDTWRHSIGLNFIQAPSNEVETMIVFELPPGEDPGPRQCLKAPTDDDESDFFDHLLTYLLDRERTLKPAKIKLETDSHELSLRTGPQVQGKRFFSYEFAIKNDGKRPFPSTDLELRDGVTEENYIVKVMFDTPSGKLPSQIPRGEELRGALVARNPARLSNGWMMRLKSSEAIRHAAFNWDLDDEPPPPPRAKGKLAVGVQLLAGAMQLKNDAGDSDWTALRGIGMRATYGIFRNLSIEGGLDLMTTGDAEFTADKATLTGGRLQLNGLLHFGDQFVPYARIGVSGLAASQSIGDESSFRLDQLFSLGIGMNAWLGDTLVLGVAAGGSFGAVPSVEFHANIAYAWGL